MSAPGLAVRVANSAMWRVGKSWADSGLKFATFVVLARYLTPAEFGIFAIVSVFVSISGILAAGGMGDVLIRDEAVDEELKNTVFWSTMVLTALCSGTLMAVSPLIARSVGSPDVETIIIVLSLSMCLGPLTAVNNAMAHRELEIRRIETVGIVCSMVGSLSSISVAVCGGGLWALVAGGIISSMIGIILTQRVFPWWPRLRFSWSRYKSIASFSGNMLAAQLMQALVGRIQELIASALLSLPAVGLYRISNRFSEVVCQSFVSPISTLALPALSKFNSEPERRSNAYLRMIGATSLIYSPLILGFAAVADDVIPLVFGNAWAGAAPVVQILSLLAPATILAYFHGPALSAAGRSDVLRRITMVQFMGTIIFSAVGAMFGITGLAIAFVLRSYLTLPFQIYWLKQSTGIRADRGLWIAAQPFLASLAMAAVVISFQPLAREIAPHTLIRLAISSSIGACVYALIMLIGFRSMALSELETLRGMLSIKIARKSAIRKRG